MSDDIEHLHLSDEEIEALHEFEERPVGRHSPGLQKIVNRMRGAPVEGKYVLFCTKPHREWVLARMNGRAKPITIFWDKVFADMREAEIAIYKLRLAEMHGDADRGV